MYLLQDFMQEYKEYFPVLAGDGLFFSNQFAIIPVQFSSGGIFHNIENLGFLKCNMYVVIRRKYTKLKSGAKEWFWMSGALDEYTENIVIV